MSWTSDPPTVPGMFGNATPERRGSNMSSFIDSLMDDAKWRSYIISKLEKNKPYSPKMSNRVGVSPTFSDVDFVGEAHALAQPGEDPTPEEVWNTDRTCATTYPNAYPYDFTYPVTSPNAGWKWATKGYVPDGWDIGCRTWTPIDPPPIHTIIPSGAIEPTEEVPLFGLNQSSTLVDHHFKFDHAAKPLASICCSPANHITVSPHIHITPEKAKSTKSDRESSKKARKSRSLHHHKKKRPHLVPVVEIETKPRIGDPILVVPLSPTHEEKISTNSKPIVTSSTSSTPVPPIEINDVNTRLEHELNMLKRALRENELLCAQQHNKVKERLDDLLPVEVAKWQDCQRMMMESMKLLKEATMLSMDRVKLFDDAIHAVENFARDTEMTIKELIDIAMKDWYEEHDHDLSHKVDKIAFKTDVITDDQYAMLEKVENVSRAIQAVQSEVSPITTVEQFSPETIMSLAHRVVQTLLNRAREIQPGIFTFEVGKVLTDTVQNIKSTSAAIAATLRLTHDMVNSVYQTKLCRTGSMSLSAKEALRFYN